MSKKTEIALRDGFETAYIDSNLASSPEYRPSFVSNNRLERKKVLSSIEDELLRCERFYISVAFITLGGIEPLLQTLKELERKGVPGQILTTNYQTFSEPRALEKLNGLENITVKMYDSDTSESNFHIKGYIFRKEEIYRIIIGSSNLTAAALTCNKEWNARLVSTEEGELAQDFLKEFNELWNSEYALSFDQFFDTYKERYSIVKHQKEIAKREEIPSLVKYALRPNSMQENFIANLREIINKGENRALLISATGTGKTYASAFAMRELGFKHVLFLVHRGQLAKQTERSYKLVFDKKVTMGLVGAGYSEYNRDYIFATVQTLNKDRHLFNYDPDEFDCIILDEAHHSVAGTYQKIMSYFTPKLFLGMTATPDRRDDSDDSNIYELFHYQIALEIRLQQAMEEKLLCPFHYFGISDISLINEKHLKERKLDSEDFKRLTCDERVRHIIEQAEYYGYSGNRVKGLIFCSRIDESRELSKKFNDMGYRTVALNGDTPEAEREAAFERLASDDERKSNEWLDYIFSVEILNEGVDIIEVNQVIMLRPTQSPIVFIQQLGRGLRKASGKDFVVVLDFIGNYQNNFMIPVALSGDRTYNADTIRKYVISGSNTIPGESTIHFDEIAKTRIFESIDKIRGIKTIIRESYINLKNKLGRRPLLIDFYRNGEIDPLLIIKEYKTYFAFMEAMERFEYKDTLTEPEKITIEYLSKTILSGVRPEELLILKHLLIHDSIDFWKFADDIFMNYGYDIEPEQFGSAIDVLQGNFVTNEAEHEKYKNINILRYGKDFVIERMKAYADRLADRSDFRKYVEDIISVGFARYEDKYSKNREDGSPFVLYEKYSRRDVSLLMNCGRDLSSIMFGMKRIEDDVFIFITYHKQESTDKNYVEGKPDYADAFEDNFIFKWDSQIGKNKTSSYMMDVISAPRKHLMVKKSDAESDFYYLGQFDIIDAYNSQKEDNNGRLQPITKVTMRMHRPVRDDLLRYLQSDIQEKSEAS